MDGIRANFQGKTSDDLSRDEIRELQKMPDDEFLLHVRHMAEVGQSRPRSEKTYSRGDQTSRKSSVSGGHGNPPGAEPDVSAMVRALKDKPGTHTRNLWGGAEVLYWIRRSGGGFVGGWERRASGGMRGASSANAREVSFGTHADALEFLEEDFDAPLKEQSGRNRQRQDNGYYRGGERTRAGTSDEQKRHLAKRLAFGYLPDLVSRDPKVREYGKAQIKSLILCGIAAYITVFIVIILIAVAFATSG